ncbi:MAG: HU family DNA-binding protein [Oscillospiraceae bacterium]|nr:HU family DNA-binding protein [Oscillospiraceae bacterium]
MLPVAVLIKTVILALPGFGTFSVAHQEARQGHNLQTGEPMEIPAHNTPSFKPDKNLKEAVC